mgnify:CR=1 FL=1
MPDNNVFNPECITFSQMNLLFNARIYFRRLTIWVWAYIISRYYGIGSPQDLFSRLYLESMEISNMLTFVFGREYSQQYSELLSDFPIGLSDLITAQLEGNAAEVNNVVDRMYDNVAIRAAFLEELNPYWNAEQYREYFGVYLTYIFEIINSIIAGDFTKIIQTFDLLNDHTNLMGDQSAQGMYYYITSGVGTDYEAMGNVPCITYDEVNQIYQVKMVWFELATWTRNYLLSEFIGVGAQDEVFERLRHVFDNYVNTMREIYGDEFANESQEVLYGYLDLLRAYIDAQVRGDEEELNRLIPLLYENADRRAALIASVNPIWDEEEWRNRQNNNIRYTIEEAVSFLSEDYARNIGIYSRLIDLAESTSNYLAIGLFDHFFSQRISNP